MQRGLVVVGASLAGLRAVEAARRDGYAGPVTLVGAEEHPPYDRPPLSKSYLDADDEPAPTVLSTADKLTGELDVTLRLGAPATALDLAERAVVVDGAAVPYDALIVATGSAPRALPGADGLRGVHALRTVEDAAAVRAALHGGARTVVVGAGFIGSEVAAAARKRDVAVTVVEALPVPLAGAVGEDAGRACAALHEANGTTLRCGSGVTGLRSADGAVTGVELADGTVLDAELVLVGIGVMPNTGWLAGALELDDDGGVHCDARLRAAPGDQAGSDGPGGSGAGGVYAAGDIAAWPDPRSGRRMRVEHWTTAAETGRHAGRSVAGDVGEFGTVPYFWSDQYGSKIQFIGVRTDEVTVVSEGDAGPGFLALYRDGDRIAGALGIDKAGRIAKFRKMIADGATFDDALAVARQ